MTWNFSLKADPRNPILFRMKEIVVRVPVVVLLVRAICDESSGPPLLLPLLLLLLLSPSVFLLLGSSCMCKCLVLRLFSRV